MMKGVLESISKELDREGINFEEYTTWNTQNLNKVLEEMTGDRNPNIYNNYDHETKQTELQIRAKTEKKDDLELSIPIEKVVYDFTDLRNESLVIYNGTPIKYTLRMREGSEYESKIVKIMQKLRLEESF